ncbi:MAG: radical SAM protein [Desulfovibrionales bacterium]
MNEFKYIFGPVRSGRLGLSLGLDLLGESICSFDCLYCEVGRTTIKTVQRRPYVPAGEILSELERWLSLGLPRPDCITLGGSGEPCLNSELETILRGVGELAPDIPRAVLTNSTLLGDPDVARALNLAQTVLPSMDTLVEEEYRRLNRPDISLSVREIAASLLHWRTGYHGRVLLEILLVKGINDSEENLALLRDFCSRLTPDRVDVVTLTRPGAYPSARAVDGHVLERWRRELGAMSPASREKRDDIAPPATTVDEAKALAVILASLKRRPQTTDQLSSALGIDTGVVETAVNELQENKSVVAVQSGDTTYFVFKCNEQH